MISIPMFILLTIASASVLRPLNSCSHQPGLLEPSAWHDRLLTNSFVPSEDTNSVHLLNLQTSLQELVHLINLKKNTFARDELKRSFSYLERSFETVSYPSLEPGSLPSFTDAYSTFQRLSLALEVVRLDLERHEDGTARTQRLWIQLERGVGRVLEQLFTELEVQGGAPAPLGRTLLPESLRCVRDSIGRDTRDFLILRSLLRAAQVYSNQLRP